MQVLEAQGESSLSLQLNGRVSVLLPLSLSPSPTPTRLFVATEKRQCCVLNISSSIHDDDDDADDHVVTWNHGLVERLGRPVEGGHLGTCSSSQNGSAATAVVALHVYQGILHFIHFNNNKKGGGTGVSSIPTVFTARYVRTERQCACMILDHFTQISTTLPHQILSVESMNWTSLPWNLCRPFYQDHHQHPSLPL